MVKRGIKDWLKDGPRAELEIEPLRDDTDGIDTHRRDRYDTHRRDRYTPTGPITDSRQASPVCSVQSRGTKGWWCGSRAVTVAAVCPQCP
jgi:hypothetical protein